MAEKRFRTLELELTRADSKARTFPASLSSEEPYERAWGIEILEHSPGAVDLGRAVDGLPLLFAHDPQRPVGMVEGVRLEGRRLAATARFFSTEPGEEAARMVREGLRTLSIGYLVDAMEQDGDRDGTPIFKVRRWTLLECSLVTIPADTTVGIGRSQTNIQWKESRKMDHNDTAGDVGRADEADRLKAIVSIGRQYSKYLGPNDVADACERGHSVEKFKDMVISKMESRHTDTRDPYIDLSSKERGNYSLGRAIAAAVSGDWSRAGFEREVSRSLEREAGRPAVGFYVPSHALGLNRRDFNVGTATEAGNLVATDLRADLFVDALRASMVMAGLGAKFLPGLSSNLDVPRKATAGSLGMLTEIGSASETAPVTAKLTLSPKRIGAFTEYSKQALIQSAIAIEDLIRRDLVTGAAVLLEYQIINGAGTGAEIAGIRNTSGIGTVVGGTAGAAPTWAHLVELESKCADANAAPGSLAGYIINSKTRAKLKQTAKGTGFPDYIWPDAPPRADGFSPLNGYRAAVTNNIVSNLTKGSSSTVCSNGLFSADWSMCLVGLFGPPDVTVDPYTLAATGQVRITLNQFVDAGVRQPAAFAKIDDWLA